MLLAIVVAIVLCFGVVVVFGAPYVPSFHRQAEIGLELLELKPGDTLIELGSGDGRVMRMAARRGIKVVGYELNPILVIVSYIVTFSVRKNVKIVWGDFWRKELDPADGMFVFLISRYMNKLNKKIEHYPHRPIRLASFAFQIPGKKINKSKHGVYLYHY